MSLASDPSSNWPVPATCSGGVLSKLRWLLLGVLKLLYSSVAELVLYDICKYAIARSSSLMQCHRMCDSEDRYLPGKALFKISLPADAVSLQSKIRVRPDLCIPLNTFEMFD